jgi:hypothetical protein
MSSPGQRQIPDHEQDDDLATDEQLAAYEAGLARIEARVRQEHPELFDEAGQLRAEDAVRYLLQRTGGRRVLTGEELLALAGRNRARLADAP